MAECRDIRPSLSGFVDGTLDADTRPAVAAHVRECAACAGLVDDFERLRGAARRLGPIDPPGHLWMEIAGRMRLDGADTGGAGARPPAAARGAVWQWIGLAAALVVVTLGVYVMTRPPAPGVAPAPIAAGGNPLADGTVEAFAEELRLALEHYEKAIAQLETIAARDREALDPAVVALLQENLAVIDRAIGESRSALADSPESVPARESLFEALRRKVSVLQDTVALVNEMRKGNQEGAARVAAQIGKSS